MNTSILDPISNKFQNARIDQSRTFAKTIVILSSCCDSWGGSEELWSGSALSLAAGGHQVAVVKHFVNPTHTRIRQLREAQVQIEEYDHHHRRSFFKRVIRRFIFFHNQYAPAMDWLIDFLKRLSPHLVVIAQGENFDGLHFIDATRASGCAYVIVNQKASDQKWPHDLDREKMREAHLNAERVYFVSQHNQRLTELQIGKRLSNAEIVRNPVLVPKDKPQPWPESESGFRLACVGRLFALEKGQDVLLHVLSQDKWLTRPLSVTFFGNGMNERGLKEAAAMVGATNVRFAGFTSDISAIWRNHHALVLPSRCEGLPLALVEAMLCGRPAIVTDVGGNSELVVNDYNGFLADSLSVSSLDGILERAWNQRHDWALMGKRAAESAYQLVGEDPCGTFATKLLEVCN